MTPRRPSTSDGFYDVSRGRTQSALADINITPLVDVVLVLLLIFMVTAPVLQSGVEVAVPQTRTVNQLTEEHTVVTIDKDQNVFLNDKPVNVHDLPELSATERWQTEREARGVCARGPESAVWRVCFGDGLQ